MPEEIVENSHERKPSIIDKITRSPTPHRFRSRKWKESDTTDNGWITEKVKISHWKSVLETNWKRGSRFLYISEFSRITYDYPPTLLMKPPISLYPSYLSSEQSLNYLIKFDDAGKLRWARNNDLVDTTAGRWKDSGNGGGIVPEDMPDRPVQTRGSFESLAEDDDRDSNISGSSVQSDAAMHYVGSPKGKTKWAKMFYRYFTLREVTNRLSRKAVRRNTWIYITVRR